MRRLGVGIVGFGRIGAEHAAWLRQTETCEAVAVFDPTPARRAMAEERGLRSTETIDELLSDARVDAVLIATPTSMHFDHARAALAAGKHMMVEKPVTLDARQALELGLQAKEVGKVVSVFHCRRWDADFLTVAATLRSGWLGRVFNVESRLGQWASCVGPAAKEYRPGWRNEAAFGGGGLYDWGSHFIDQLWQLFLPAKPARVFAQLCGNVWTSDCDDFARVLIDFDNGATGLCEINTTTTRPLARWHLDGTLGSASSPHSPSFDTARWAELDVTLADGTSHRVPQAVKGLVESEIWEGFARACQTGGPPPITLSSVLMTMALLDAARQSSAEGRAVDVRDRP